MRKTQNGSAFPLFNTLQEAVEALTTPHGGQNRIFLQA